MSYIKVEHPFCKTDFLASDVQEEKQKCEGNMVAFHGAQRKLLESKGFSHSTSSLAAERGIHKQTARVGQLIWAAKSGDFTAHLGND